VAIDFLQPAPAIAETLASPKFVSAAVMPNGEVGLLYANGDNGVNVSAEIRFSRYTTEHAMPPSSQLSTAGAAYPQLATFRGRLVAGYVDTRGANYGKFVVRVSDDSGVSWAAESYLFAGETFDAWVRAPLLVASHDEQTLYLFSANGVRPQYRSSTDPTLASWTAAADAGDTTIRDIGENNCGSAGNECYRAHDFSFMETTTPGQWIYIGRSDSLTGAGRGTQVGTLGPSAIWSPQFDHGGGGGSSGGDGTATTFLDRAGNVIYLRGSEYGDNLYYNRSTDGGATWGPALYAYLAGIPNYLTGPPVGLYDANYTRGEYVWYTGSGGIENALRVIPLWEGPRAYSFTGSVRLFGSAGGDLDAGSAYEYNFGDAVRSLGGGGYVTGATDLAVPGRLLDLGFSRTYNSANGFDAGVLGPAWTHSFHWWLTDNGAIVTIRRGSGRQDKFTRQPDGSYTNAPGVFDTLVKTADTAYTLTSREQVSYDFIAGRLTKIREPAGNQITFGYAGLNLVRIPLGGTVSYSASRCCAAGYEPDKAANGKINNLGDPGNGWQLAGYIVGDWWKATWSAAQTLTRVRLWDFYLGGDFYGQGHLEFSDGSTVSFGPLPNDAGPGGEDFREVSFARKSGITWMKVVSDSLGTGYPGLSEVEAYDDESATPTFDARLNVVTDTVGRRVSLGYASDANLALGKTYTQSVVPDASFPDTGGTELTDGLRGDSALYNDRSWEAHQNLASPLEVTVDLGTAQPIGVVRSYYHDFSNDAVYRPASVEVLTSTDNVIFTSRGTVLAAASVQDVNRRFIYDLAANATARWVRLRITKGGTWLFSSEIRVAPLGAVQPTAMVGDRLVTLTDPIGRKVAYRYDDAGRLTGVVDMLGNAPGQDPGLHTWTYAYDGGSNHISSITDPDGRVAVANTYDSLGRLDTQKDGLLNTTTFGYPAGQVTITDPRLHVTTQTFDARNRLISLADTVDAVPYTFVYTYDGCGNRDSATDRNGKRTSYTYDCAGNLLEVEEPQLSPPAPGYITTYEPDARNNPHVITDALGFVTTNDYDPVTNALVKSKQQITKLPDTFAVTKLEYSDAANPGLATRIISPRGNVTDTPNYTYSQTLEYFTTGELLRRTDADGNKTTFTYDGASRQLTMVDPDGNIIGGTPSQHTWTTSYDANDRVTAVIDALGHSALSGYDRTGNRTSATDRDGNVTSYIYDAAARLWKVQQKPDPLWQPTLVYTTTVLRDGNGNATQVTQDKQGAGGAITVFTDYGYDALNRLQNMITHPGSPANLTTSYELDGNGNTTKRTTGDGVATNYQYDALNRVFEITATGLATIAYGYNELSQRTSMSDETGPSTYAYDGLGRLTQAIQPGGTLGYEYDLDSNRTKLTYPTVGAVTYVPSPAGRLSTVTDWASRQSSYTYSPSGLAKTVVVPTVTGNLTTTYSYDNAQRLTSLLNATSTQTISSHTYTLDSEGNRTALDETVSGLTTAAAQLAASLQVNTDSTTTVQDHPAIALGADATLLIWDDARSGNADIYFSLRDALTGTWSTPNVKVNTDATTRLQQNPAVAVDASSSAYAVWQDERSGAGKPDIYYRKRTAAGTWVSPDVKVNDDAGGGGGAVQRNPRIAGRGDGTQTAVWVDLRSSQNNIYSSTLSPAGSWTPPNKKVTDNTAAAKDFPDVVVAPDGTSYAAWQDSRSGNADIYFSSLPSGGSAWSANVKISDDPGTAAQRSPRIAIDRAGTLTVVFLDDRVSPSQVRAVRRPLGGSWSASVVVTDAAARPTAPLALAVRDDGSAQTAWSDTRIANTDIWGSRYEAATSVWSTSTLLSDDPGLAAQSSPTLAYLGGELASAWRDDRGGNGNVRARRTPGDHSVYRYDGLNRLTGVLLLNSESFALDGASNVTDRSGVSETYDAANRLTVDGGTSNSWSNADQLHLRGADVFNYDALDRLKDSTVGGSLRNYTYDGDGLLKSRTGGGATTFLWDPSTAPSRELKQGSDNLIYGLGPLYVVKADASTSTFARDGSKGVRSEVNSAGSVTASFRYKAYGQVAQSNGAASPSYLGYAGQLLDSSGLYYMRARWYDPITGRFLTRDPLGGVADTPVTLNLFAYGSASPTANTDPTGMSSARGDEAQFLGVCDLDCWRAMRCGACDVILFGARANIRPQGDVLYVTNAAGLMGWLTYALGFAGNTRVMTLDMSGQNTVTYSANLIVSSAENLHPSLEEHEFQGHRPQALERGPLYIPYYLSTLSLAPGIYLGALLTGTHMDPHYAIPLERDAEIRAGHGDPWIH
jgi:RHS repeat-associated protein